jgi:hypothetical protein
MRVFHKTVKIPDSRDGAFAGRHGYYSTVTAANKRQNISQCSESPDQLKSNRFYRRRTLL